MSSKRKHVSDEEEDREEEERGGEEEEEGAEEEEEEERRSPTKKRKTAKKGAGKKKSAAAAAGKKGAGKTKNKKKRGASSAEEEEEEGEGDDYEEAAAPAAKKASGTNKKKTKGAAAAGSKRQKKPAAAEQEEEEEDTSLFGMVKNRTAMSVTVAEWISRYQEDAHEAMRELLNFILKACGYPLEVSKAVYLKQDIGRILGNIVEDEKYKAEGGQYPIIGRGPMRKFKNNFLEFWDKLINKTQYTIIYDEAFLGNLVTIALVVSSSVLRPFRHTGTLLGLQLMASTIRVVNIVTKELQVTLRQIKSAKSKASARPTKSETAKVNDLTEKAHDLKEKIDVLDERMDQIFKGIFVHRYRDIFAEIRAECVTSLGEWVVAYPTKFLNDKTLKYAGWMLSDRNSDVRLSAIRALIGLYADENNYVTLDVFTQRFKGRILQCTLDTETSVSLAAIELATKLAELGALDGDDMNQLNGLLSDSSVRIRFAAAEYLNNAVLKEVTVDARDKKDAQRLQLRELLTFIIKHTHQPKNPNYVVDALWEQTSALKAWGAMSRLMIEPQDEPDMRERAALAALINACVKKASGLAICPKDKSDPDALIKTKEKVANQQKLSKHFAKHLPALLEQCKTEPDQIEELVELPQYFDFDTYHTDRLEKHFGLLLEQLHDIYLNNTRESILKTCAKTYKAMLSQEHAMRKEAEVAFGRLTDELADRLLQALPTLDPAEGPVELGEEAEFALRMALARIHHLYAVLDLARLDLYGPVKQLLDAQVSGMFPMQYEKIMVFVVGVLGQHLLWSAAKFKPKTGDATTIAHERDEFIQQLSRLLRPDVAAPDVQDKAYLFLCDLALVFRPGIKHKAQRQIATPLGSLPDTLREFVESALNTPRERKTKNVAADDDDEEEDEEIDTETVEAAKRKAAAAKKRKGKKKKTDEDDDDDDDSDAATKRNKRKAAAAKGAARKAKQAKDAQKAAKKAKKAEDEDLVEPEIDQEEQNKERRERALTPYESTERKIRLIGGLAKLVVYNVIPRAENAPALLVHYVRHGKQVKATLRQFLAQLRAGDDNVRSDTDKVWVIILDTMKKEYQNYLDAEEDIKSVVLEDFKELALRLAFTFGVAQKKTRNALITLVHSGIMYAAEDVPANLHFLSGLPRFVSSLASQTTAKYILTTFHEEMQGKYSFDKSDKACDPYFAFLAHLQKTAKVTSDEQDIDDDLDVGAGSGKKTAASGKGKAAAKKTKKKSKIPALELEKVPDRRPKVSKTARIVADAHEEEEEDGEEEEEEGLKRGGKKGKKTAAKGKKGGQKKTTTKKTTTTSDDADEGLSGEELIEEMEE